MSAVADVLRAAADRLERTGKCEGKYWDPSPDLVDIPRADLRACALGAIKDATDIQYRRRSAERAILQALQLEDGVVYWSDSHSLDEVVAGLRAAADGAA